MTVITLHLLSKHWVELFGNVAFFAVHLLLADFYHYIRICLSIRVCRGQVGCLGVEFIRKTAFINIMSLQ